MNRDERCKYQASLFVQTRSYSILYPECWDRFSRKRSKTTEKNQSPELGNCQLVLADFGTVKVTRKPIAV